LAAEISTMMEEATDGAARFQMESILKDREGNEVAKAMVHWHVKAWDDVRFKPTS
jgi:hypothetical protein